MIFKLYPRVWLFTLIGAFLFCFAPCHVHADEDVMWNEEGGGNEKQDPAKGENARMRQRADQGQNRQGREAKVRNMHPELQVASPYRRNNDDEPKD